MERDQGSEVQDQASAKVDGKKVVVNNEN